MKIFTRTVWDMTTLEKIEEEWFEYEGPVSSATGGGGQSTNTVTENADPWVYQQPYLLGLFRQAADIYNSQSPSYYTDQSYATQYQPSTGSRSKVVIDPTSRIAGFSPETVQAQDYLTGIATNQLPQMLQEMAQAQSFGLGPVMDVGNNPYVAGAAQAAINPVFNELYRNTLPSIGSEALVNGGYGGSRQQLAQGIAAGEASRNALDMTRTLYGDAYDTGVDAYIKALAMAPQTLSAMSLPGTLLDTVGQQKQAYQQALIDEGARQWDFYQQAPWDWLGNYSNMIQGFYGGSSIGTSAQDVASNPAMNAAGGAMAGYAAGAMMGSSYGPYGAAAGALIGLLMS